MEKTEGEVEGRNMKRIFVSSVQREFAQVRKQLKAHLSRNPAYRRLTGFTDLLADCRAAGLRDPVIDDSRMEFTITIYRPADKLQISANKSGTGIVNDEEIISLIIKNPTLSMQEYANKLQIKYSVLRGRIAKLKAKGLRHEGSRKAGQWIFFGHVDE